MATPHLKDGVDRTSFAPFTLLKTAEGSYSVMFSKWEHLRETLSVPEEIEGVYINGYSFTALWRTQMMMDGHDPDTVGWDPEADMSVAYGPALDKLAVAAAAGATLVKDKASVLAAIHAAKENGQLNDWD
jgi:hypothetical protein